jgi:hypothetical protein
MFSFFIHVILADVSTALFFSTPPHQCWFFCEGIEEEEDRRKKCSQTRKISKDELIGLSGLVDTDSGGHRVRLSSVHSGLQPLTVAAARRRANTGGSAQRGAVE